MAITGLNRRVGPVTGPPGKEGPHGESAYQIAWRHGFRGTEEEFLASLVGPQGEEGMEGPPGPKGEPGTGLTIKGSFVSTDDLPAIAESGDTYLVDGHLYFWEASTGEWQDAGQIQGPEGPQGEEGPEGPPGPPGEEGPPGPQPPLGGSGESEIAARVDHDHDGVYSEEGHRHTFEDVDGVVDIAQLPVGSGEGTVAPGNHDHEGTYAPVAHTHAYAPLAHTHDDRYHTKTENTSLLAGKANASHHHNETYSQRGHTHTILPSTWIGGSVSGRTIDHPDGTWITLYENEWGFSHATYALMWVIACEVYGDHGVTGNLRYRVTLNDGTPVTSGAFQADQGVDSTKVWTYGSNLNHNRAGGQLKFKLEIQMMSGVYTIRSGSWSLLVSPRVTATNAAP